jgi:ligand-binding SRPBCC domain-containing protein
VKTYQLTREQFVPLDTETVFAFFADAHNLERLTPPWLQFRILTPGPIVLEAGSTIDYALKLHGMPVRWRSEIICWQPPHRFIDEQRKGPYRRWVHTHTFVPMGDGTLVTDDVEFAVTGPELVTRLFVRPDLERIFDYRSRELNAWVIDTLREQAESQHELRLLTEERDAGS